MISKPSYVDITLNYLPKHPPSHSDKGNSYIYGGPGNKAIIPKIPRGKNCNFLIYFNFN